MTNKILDNTFLNTFKDLKPKFSAMGECVYLRTYSRYLESEKRRETWYETVLRTTLYNIQLGIDFKKRNGIKIDWNEEKKEAELLFKNLFNFETFTSGRTLYMGGTEIVKEYPLSNFNCCFTNLSKFSDLKDIFYLLMVGAGVGVKIDKENVKKLPSVFKKRLINTYDETVRKHTSKEDMENTILNIENNKAIIKVGDSKEGWCDSLELYFDLITMNDYKDIDTIEIDYSFIRPEGEILKRFGGRASGHKSIQKMFSKIQAVIESLDNNKIKTINALDLCTIISENVVSGGVRRSAMIILCDEDDKEVIEAKRNLYTIVDGNYVEDKNISHRRMSNNSILFKEKPSLEKIKEILSSIKINGEPGFINGIEAKRRKVDFEGCNPCGEILLKSKSCCNLSTNNLLAFVEDGKLNLERLKEALRLSTRLSIRMTLIDAELPEWDKTMKKDRVIGISLTGIIDMINATGMVEEVNGVMNYDKLSNLLSELRDVVHAEGERYCKELNISVPKLMTTIKPEGTISTLPGVSSGIHAPHSPYTIRRVRFNTTDPLLKMMEDFKCYPIFPEVGQTEDNCTVKVVEFPMKSPSGRTKFDIGAIEQLALYKLTMENWTDHNTSITVHVKEEEWDLVANWLYDNWDTVVGITFLPLDTGSYPLLPFEATTKEDYEDRVNNMRKINLDILKIYDTSDEQEIIDSDCSTGVCPVR